MLALVSTLAFVGYTLVYAAVANGGALAAKPWEALRTDAYQVETKASAGGTLEQAGLNLLKAVKWLTSLIPGAPIP